LQLGSQLDIVGEIGAGSCHNSFPERRPGDVAVVARSELAAPEQVPGSTTVFGVGWIPLSTKLSGAIMGFRT